MIAKAPRDSLGEICAQVVANRAIKENMRAVMLEKIALRAPEMVVRERETTSGEAIDKSVIYVTRAGLRCRQAEYQFLVGEKIPEAIAEVGRAQAFGDLSENAEWTAALEKRDNLGTRANEMEAELRKAVPITPDLYREGVVSLGCRVEVKDVAEGRAHAWRVLGPWDGDLSGGVLNYLSPVGRALLGHRPGDVVAVELPEGTQSYEILAVCRADAS